MASGKSTVSEILSSKFNKSVHLRGDIFRKMIVSGREEMSENASDEAISQLYLRYRLSAETAKAYFDNGFSVVLQDNYYGEALKYMLKLLEGYPVRTVVLCPCVAEVEKREKSRNKVGYRGFKISELYESFIKETPRTGYWIDSSDQTPDETVNDILTHFNKI